MAGCLKGDNALAAAGQMKPRCKHRRLAGIVAVAAMTAGCAASLPAGQAHRALEGACTTLPIARPSAAGISGQHPRPGLLPPGVVAVAAQSSSSAWAVGPHPTDVRPEKAVVAHWNGAAWTTFSPAGLPRLSSLRAVAAFPGGAWAVGESGLTDQGDGGGRPEHLIVRLTGTTMRRVPVPGPADGELEDVAATSAANVWAVGYIGGVTGGLSLLLHWNGTAWKRTPLPAMVGRDGNAGDIVAVDATSTTNAWAVGNLPAIVHWNGRRWGQVVSPDIGTPYVFNDVAATSARNVWAVGDGLDKQVVVILHWNGRRWTCALSPKVPFTYLVAVSASSADNAWAVGGTGDESLALHWNGHSWKQVITPQPGQVGSLDDVAFIPQSGFVWAIGGRLLLHWNGTAWR